ncbi:MAG: M23 family metallopeptidase [Rhodospirillales bacterium]|nr:M23 family metallopeptidase [Rhodospirillales bacterium]MCB9997037.1 M23 family metallopeptidase [Rhodospirillales bacterium]
MTPAPLFLAILILFMASLPAHAQDPVFTQPVDCRLGTDCWIVNYVDTDPSENNARDFTCGPLTYDAHHGTDFGIADQVTMEIGTDILAAADGTILRVRDEIEDKMPTEDERKKMLEENRGCGNGVFIDHGNGWQTIYCHMKQGSVVVKPGQKVKAGTPLGEIGQSGIAEFPHLHFGVFFENSTIDPFTGLDDSKGCGNTGTSMWQDDEAITYSPVSIYASGFKDGAPDFDAIKIDSASKDIIASSANALTFWVAMYGVAKDDQIAIEIRKPDGTIFARQNITQPKDRARQFYFIGRKINEDGLAPGTYTGHIRLTRKQSGTEDLVREQSRTVRIR